jgi:hypothetical protein
MTTQTKPTSITVIGRRWFQRGPGNTYHTTHVLIDGVSVWKSGRTYGYGNHYMQTAQEWLEANGYLPDLEHYKNGMSEILWQYCKRVGIALTDEVIDVSRQKDL